jgi:hypothetical protein
LGKNVHPGLAYYLAGSAVGDAVDGGAALETDAHGAERPARLAADGGATGESRNCDSYGDCGSGFDGPGLAVDGDLD